MNEKNSSVFLHRVMVRNYKSIAACDTRLGALTILVGANGSGKSNFLDALSFVADALNTSLDHALRQRGGINDVRRRSRERPNNFSIRLDFVLGHSSSGHYAFTVRAKQGGGFEVLEEECRISANGILDYEYFRISKGSVALSSLASLPAYTSDRLYLVRLSGEPGFRPLFDALSRMAFYSLAPNVMRRIQPASEGLLLANDGANVASVFDQMPQQARDRVIEYLAAIVPGIEGIAAKQMAGNETVEFRQRTDRDHKPQPFLANSMSDGALRALGILVALFQGRAKQAVVPLVAVEEPEIALHPAAAGVLLDILRQAADDRQVIVTSHSPELLDSPDITVDELLSVEEKEGATVIAPIDESGRIALRERLYTPGELLRMNQLAPDESELLSAAQCQQLKLFEL